MRHETILGNRGGKQDDGETQANFTRVVAAGGICRKKGGPGNWGIQPKAVRQEPVKQGPVKGP